MTRLNDALYVQGFPVGPSTVVPGGLFRGMLPGGRILYVNNHSSVQQGDGSSADRPLASIEAAVTALVAGSTSKLGSCIMVGAGHAESVDEADWLSELSTLTSLSILGMGFGSDRPSLTWTIATSKLILDTVNLELGNMRLFLAGAHAAGSALTVANPISVTAAGVRIVGNEIRWGFDADQIVGDGIIWTGSDGVFAGNNCVAPVAAVPTNTFLTLTGTDNMQIFGNRIIGATDGTTRGVIDSETTANTNLQLYSNTLKNLLASSTIAASFVSGDTGEAWGNRLFVNSGILPFTAGELEWYQNYVTNGEGEAGALVGTASA